MSTNRDLFGKPKSVKYRQLTCDLDSRNIDTLIKCLKVLKKHGFTEELYIGLSPSKKGYHLISWHNKQGVTKEKMMEIRKKIDDPIRIILDQRTGRQSDVLFSKKTKRRLVFDG